MKKSIKSILWGFLLVLLVACNASKSTTRTAENPAKEEKLAKSLLWKITGNEIEKASYLYGTIHLTCDYELKEKMKTAFAETTQVVLEVDMDDPQMQMKAMQSMMMKDETIKSLLSEEEYSTLATYIKDNIGMDLAMFNKMKPFSLLSLLVMKSVDCETPTAYETEFVKIAKEQKEEVLGLETIESQMAIFDSIPYRDQLDDILEMAEKGLDQNKSEFAVLTDFHKNEDIEGMLKLANETEGMTKEFSEILLDSRNRNWIPVMEKMMKEKPTFFGVGAMHLAGDSGVIKLLRKQGYTVTPVN